MKLAELLSSEVADIPRDIVVIVPVASLEQHILHLPSQNPRLDRRSNCHNLIRVDSLVRILSKEFPNQFLNLRDPSGPPHQHYLVDLAPL